MARRTPLFQFDPGWPWVVAGLLFIFAATVVPAQRLLETDRAELRRLQGTEQRVYRLLEAHDRFLSDLREGEESLLLRLAAAGLNRMPAERTALALSESIDRNPIRWIESAVPAADPGPPLRSASLLEQVLSGRGRLWVTAGGVLCLFIGLLLGPGWGGPTGRSRGREAMRQEDRGEAGETDSDVESEFESEFDPEVETEVESVVESVIPAEAGRLADAAQSIPAIAATAAAVTTGTVVAACPRAVVDPAAEARPVEAVDDTLQVARAGDSDASPSPIPPRPVSVSREEIAALFEPMAGEVDDDVDGGWPDAEEVESEDEENEAGDAEIAGEVEEEIEGFDESGESEEEDDEADEDEDEVGYEDGDEYEDTEELEEVDWEGDAHDAGDASGEPRGDGEDDDGGVGDADRVR